MKKKYQYRQILAFLLDLAILLVVSAAIFRLTPETNGTESNAWKHFWPGFCQLAVCLLIFQLLLRTDNTLWCCADTCEYLTPLYRHYRDDVMRRSAEEVNRRAIEQMRQSGVPAVMGEANE